MTVHASMANQDGGCLITGFALLASEHYFVAGCFEWKQFFHACRTETTHVGFRCSRSHRCQSVNENPFGCWVSGNACCRLEQTYHLHKPCRQVEGDAVRNEVCSVLIVAYRDPVLEDTSKFRCNNWGRRSGMAGSTKSQGTYQNPMGVNGKGCWQRWEVVTRHKFGHRLRRKRRPACPSRQLGSNVRVQLSEPGRVTLLHRFICHCSH